MARAKIEIDMEEAERMASDGLTFKQIAYALGVSERTVYNRLRSDDEFCAAVNRGRARGVREVASKLKEMALDGNLQAMLFYLKNNGGWTEKARAADEVTPGPYDDLLAGL